MEIIQVYQTRNRCYQRARTAKHVGIVVHSTGAVNTNLKRYVDAPDRLGVNQYKNHWNTPDTDKCMHAFIGYDKNRKVIVAQTLPYDYCCWGCGAGKKGSYNYPPTAHIQFEICQGSDTDEGYYRQAIAVAEEYCAHLCKKYGWTVKDICSHREAAVAGYASNHGDPESWMKHFGDNMDKFRARVAARLGAGGGEDKTEEVEPDSGLYTVQKGDSLWRIAGRLLGSGRRYTEICELNGLTSTRIHPGMKLKIPKK